MPSPVRMPTQRYATIVAGLGAAGSATLYQLAKRGARVLGIDRFAPPHALGSSHGDTRITRLAIGEGAHYTPLAVRSHALWRTLERESGQTLLTTNGGLIVSSARTSAQTHASNFFANTLAAAQAWGIAHETLDAPAIRRRFPRFAVSDDEVGYFEPSAGFVRPEATIRAHLAVARASGADVRFDERLIAFEPNGERIGVATTAARYECDTLVVATGAWLPSLVGARCASIFRVYRQTLLWFDVDGPIGPFGPERFPVFIWELPRGRQGLYGFPALDGERGGLKVGTESFAATTTADGCDRDVSSGEIEATYRDVVGPYLRGVSSRCVRTATCLYTVTPDFGFIVDALPGACNVLIASPCSGHGFKHSPALGELLAQWAIEREKPAALAPFALSRFGVG